MSSPAATRNPIIGEAPTFLGMLEQVITYNVIEDGSFREDLPLFGGTKIMREKPNKKNNTNPPQMR